MYVLTRVKTPGLSENALLVTYALSTFYWPFSKGLLTFVPRYSALRA